MKRYSFLPFLVLFLTNALFGATITIDEGIEYQTIVGFGGHPYGLSQYYDNVLPELFFNDLGITVLRTAIGFDTESSNDNDDPFNLDIDAFNPGHRAGEEFTKLASFTKYKSLKVIASVWSPPPWMKTNNSATGGGSLLPSMYDEFAEYLVGAYRIIERNIGIKLYGISIQNEIRFSQSYPSCTYTPGEYLAVFKKVTERFEAEGIDIKFFGPEDVLTAGMNYVDAIYGDTEATVNFDAVAVHGYGGDGASPYSDGADKWRAHWTQADSRNKELWMTETEGLAEGEGWSSAHAMAEGIVGALVYGNISVWCWWAMDNQFIDDNKNPTPVYHAAKHFYRYIRPGAVRIESASDDVDVNAASFIDKADNTITVVIVNSKATATTATINLGGSLQPNLFQVIQSSPPDNYSQVNDSIANGATINLPAVSVTTLFGRYIPVGAPTVTITSPTSAQVLPWSQLVNVQTSTSGGNGTVSLVEIFNGLDKLGETSSAPFTFPWLPASGNYTLHARVTNSNELSAHSAPVSIEVSAPPGGQGNGLRSEYYSGTNFETYILTDDNVNIDFENQSARPYPEVPGGDNFSVRWTGQIVPPISGDYIFTIRVDDGGRLWIANELLADGWIPQPATEYSGTISLTAHTPYELKMEYFEERSDATCQLFWQTQGLAREIVPIDRLYLPDEVVPVVHQAYGQLNGNRAGGPYQVSLFNVSGRKIKNITLPYSLQSARGQKFLEGIPLAKGMFFIKERSSKGLTTNLSFIRLGR